MKGNVSRAWLIGLVFIAFTTGGMIGLLLGREALAAPLTSGGVPAGAQRNFDLIGEAWNIIQSNYVVTSTTDAQTLTYGAISGMVEVLGDTGHSTFLTPAMREQQRNYIRGEFEGIGAEVQVKDGHVVIVAPLDGSPAQEAGVKPGDVILAVDGEDMVGVPIDEVVSRIMGEAGTPVTLTLLDPETNESRDVTVVRQKISVHSVTWRFLPGTPQIAHVRIAGFTSGVGDELESALAAIEEQGGSSILLDLRNNPGGRLDEAIEVGSQFLEDGNVLLVKDAQGRVREIPVRSGIEATDLPVVVLINQGSASASEIVAGALQDAGRAVLIGETTFGTGTVLNQFPLSDGSALLLATELWLTPAGRVIWHQGIEPDLRVELPPDGVTLTPRQTGDMTAQELQSSQDTQLLRALEELSRQ